MVSGGKPHWENFTSNFPHSRQLPFGTHDSFKNEIATYTTHAPNDARIEARNRGPGLASTGESAVASGAPKPED